MKKRLIIRIPKKTQGEWMITALFFLPFTFAGLIEFFHFPSAIKYLCDVAWIFLLILLRIQERKVCKEYRFCRGFIILFFVYTLIGYALNMSSILRYTWGLRNNFRFYVLFLGCCIFMKKKDIDIYLKYMDKIFWLNAVLCFIQYFLLGKRQDLLGGIFGVQRGSNGYLNVFLLIIIGKSLLFYLNKKESVFNCIAKSGVSFILASFAELKIFYVEFVIILVAAILITDFTWKKVMILCMGIIGLYVGIEVLINLYPEFVDTFSVNGMLAYATSKKGYTGKGDLNRLTAISTIGNHYLKTPLEKLIGMGLGSCETASYKFLTSAFYRNYSYLHYTWLSTAFVFLEMGYIGLLFFFGFFVVVFCVARNRLKREEENKVYCQLAMIMAISCILIGIYNSSLRTEAGYMVYIVLSFPIILQNKEKVFQNYKELEAR